MINTRNTYCMLLFLLLCKGWGQELVENSLGNNSYQDAYELASSGKHKQANEILKGFVDDSPEDIKARYLLGKTYSWNRNYDKARKEFNTVTTTERKNKKYWIAAIKNELYAGENAIALGLANKAIAFGNNNSEIKRLKLIAEERLNNKVYPKLGWHNTSQSVSKKIKPKKLTKEKETSEVEPKQEIFRQSRFGVNNTYTVFSERYDPIFFSNISYNHRTKIGSIIPRINFSNRSGNNGLQYEIDLYPKFLKRFYAYLNYGYSNATVYPSHKAGGDVYVNLPGAFEFSAGGRYIVTQTQNVTALTNSIGHYRGNYYFSLRSFINPRPNNLTRISANFLTRKYFKDAENYMGINFGVGYSPELRQTIAGDVLLAETLLFIESQRLSLEYQFTSKNSQNIYRARIGVRRQELAFDSGNFFWGITAGLNYQVKL